jgi:hypothetical protein
MRFILLPVILACRGTRRRWLLRDTLFPPIDLIPDFIPVIGYLDDLIIVPLGIWFVVSLIPPDVMTEYRSIASAVADRPVSKTAAIAIVSIWILCAAVIGWAVWTRF